MSPVASVSLSESNGLSFVNIENEFASAKISLFGGHVLSFIPAADNKERLWVSPHAYLNGERPIRGGIPICWPWFANDHGRDDGELPSHGFLRTQVWKLVNSTEDSKGTTVELAPSFTRAEGFEYDCSVTLRVHVGENLQVSLETENTGVIPFSFNTALHTYFHVENIKHTELKGISGDYKDKLDDWAVKPTPAPYTIDAETDRIHLSAVKQTTIAVDDKDFTEVLSQGNDSLVVWNPWQSAASISDMDPFGYNHMVCVESSVTKGLELAPGEKAELVQTVRPIT